MVIKKDYKTETCMDAIFATITSPRHSKYFSEDMLNFIQENAQRIAQLLSCNVYLNYFMMYDAIEDKANMNTCNFAYELRNTAAHYRRNWLILETALEEFTEQDKATLEYELVNFKGDWTIACCMEYILEHFNDIEALAYYGTISEEQKKAILADKLALSATMSSAGFRIRTERLYREIEDYRQKGEDFSDASTYSLSDTFMSTALRLKNMANKILN